MNTIEKLILAIIIALITGLFMFLAIIWNNTGNCEECVLSDTKIENEENINAFINSLDIN
jgi:hypothetical protein